MNKQWTLLGILAAVFLAGCSGSPQASAETGAGTGVLSGTDALPSAAGSASSASIESVKGTVWQLIEVRLPDNAISVERGALAKNNFGTYYTIQFVDEGITGRASPNNYFAPYKSSEGNSIALFPMRSTLMANDATVVQGLTERDYFYYVQNIRNWDKPDGILRLYSKNESGAGVVLSYKQAVSAE